MRELPIFLSYRFRDGYAIAERIRGELHGRTVALRSESVEVPATLSVYFDRAAPAVANWRQFLNQALERALAIIVVCSCGARHEFQPADVFYHEIRWWIKERSTSPPILLAPYGPEWIPQPINDRWPDAQRVNIDDRVWTFPSRRDDWKLIEMNIQSILGGICASVRQHIGLTEFVERVPQGAMVEMPGLYMWEKDKHFRYIRCNENYARSAGYASPEAMIGKSDDDMPWSSLADFFRRGDYQVVSGMGPPRFNVCEVELMVDRRAHILVSESQLKDRSGDCIGLTGYYIDITGKRLAPRPTTDLNDGTLSLGAEFGNISLSVQEVKVFKGILQSHSADQIASILGIGKIEVEAAVDSLKGKFRCTTEGDVIATAMRSAIPLKYFGPIVEEISPEASQT